MRQRFYDPKRIEVGVQVPTHPIVADKHQARIESMVAWRICSGAAIGMNGMPTMFAGNA